MARRKGRAQATGDRQTLGPAETEAWALRYRRHAKIWAWSFFVLVCPVILGVIWWDVGELTADVLYSFGFAVLVMLVLALWSRRGSDSGWKGRVSAKFMKKVRVRRGDEVPDGIAWHPVMTVRKDRGGKLTLRLSADLFEYFQEGDAVFKVPGFDWPEKVVLPHEERICVACGTLMTRGLGHCSRCRAPEPDHATLLRLAGR